MTEWWDNITLVTNFQFPVRRRISQLGEDLFFFSRVTPLCTVHHHHHYYYYYYYYVYVLVVIFSWGTAVAQWLRCCVTNRKVAGSIPAGVIGIFIDIKSFRSHYGPGVDSVSNRNEYQEYFLGIKAANAKADNLTTMLCLCHVIWEP